MLTFQTLVFATILLGIALIVISLIIFSRDAKSASIDSFAADNTIKAIDASISEMDKTMEEFNQLTKSVFEEIDLRYQELLFLYSLIDDKKKAIAQINSPQTNVPQTNLTQATMSQVKSRQPVSKDVRTDFSMTANTAINHPMYKNIMRLKNKGISVSEIARQLDMGQGEVKLIIELGKVR